MKHKKLMLIGVLLIFAILATNVIAGPWDKISGTIKKLSGDWNAWAIIWAIIVLLNSILIVGGDDLILMNPTVAGPNANPAIANTVNSFLYLLIPLYIIAFILTGMHFLLSQTPSGRAKAKSDFFRLIISMGAVLIALPLFQLLLDISQGITQLIFDIGSDYVSIEKVFGGTIAISHILASLFSPIPSGKLITFIFFLFSILIVIMVILLLVMRYLIVVLAAIVFPFTLVLWLSDLPYIKHAGARLMNHTIVWIFVPVITASVVVFTSIIAGGFYDKCSIAGGILGGVGGAIGGAIKGVGGAGILGIVGGIAALTITSPDCWLSFFAGLAATFLILAAPLMMYGVMVWLGATILFFGWTTAGVPSETTKGFGAEMRFFGIPGIDTIARIPGVEWLLKKGLGQKLVYAQEGKILGLTPLIEGVAPPGEVPMGWSPLLRPIAHRLWKPSPHMEGVFDIYGEKVRAPVFGPKEVPKGRYSPWASRVAIPKLGPLAVVAAGGILTGMGPAGILTAGLKGLWFEPGATFPPEMKVNVIVEGKVVEMTLTAPTAKGYGPKYLYGATGFDEKSQEWIFNIDPKTGKTVFKAPIAAVENFPEEIQRLPKNALRDLADKMEMKPEELLDYSRKGASGLPADVQQRLADGLGMKPEELPGMAGVPPPQIPEAAAETEREKKEKEIIDKLSGVLQKGSDEEQKIRRSSIPDTEKLKKIMKIKKDTDRGLDEFDKKWVGEEKKIYEKLKRDRTYLRHPEEYAKQTGMDLTKRWGAFGQSARILARQGNLMHGLKNLKVYTVTSPRAPDWVRKQWEKDVL